MAIESFRHIEYSDENKFVREKGRIELKKYTKDLIFYANYDSTLEAAYASSSITPIVSGNVSNKNNGVFAQHAHFENGYLNYHNNNFRDLKNQGSVQFRIKTDFNTAKGSQYFLATENPIVTSLPAVTTKNFRFGGASLELIGNETKRVNYNVNNISSVAQTGTFDFFLMANYTGTPSQRVGIVDVNNGVNNENRIYIYHDIDGRLYFMIYNQLGSVVVNINFDWVSNLNKNNVSFNFDLNSGNSRVFINGAQYGVTNTNTGTRIPLTGGYLGVGSSSPDISNYFIDDFAIFDVVRNTANYTVRNIALSGNENGLVFYAKYDTSLTANVGVSPVPTSFIPSDSAYRFRLMLGNTLFTGGDISVSLTTSDTLINIFNKISTALNLADVSVLMTSENNIKIESNLNGVSVEILSPTTGRNLLNLLGGVSESILPNGPTVDTDIVEFYNGSDNNNRIIITHTTESKIRVRMYDKTGVLKVDKLTKIWSNKNTLWYAFEFNWDRTIAQILVNGKLFDIFSTDIDRSGGAGLFIRAGDSHYRFDEFIIYDTFKGNYDVPNAPLTPYATDNPFIDVYFGSGFKENEVVDLKINASTDCHFAVKLGHSWYYFFAGIWRESNGSFSQSSDKSLFEGNFSALFFQDNVELVIRVYFNSSGFNNVFIDEISIIKDVTEDSPAIIKGTINLCDYSDLSSDQHIVITTNKGQAEVDLTTQVPTLPAEHIGTADLMFGFDWATTPETFSVDSDEITLDQATTTITEVLELIQPQLPSGIEAFTDGAGRVGLRTINLGAAYNFDLTEGTGGLARLGMLEGNYVGFDPDLTQVTFDQIKEAINAANVPGLGPAVDNGECNLVLVTTDRGSGAFISTSEGITSNALDLIWGDPSSDTGEEATSIFFDYTGIISWVRSNLGAPTVPVELTDEQIENAISSAVYWFNYYRSSKENLITVDLKGDSKIGFEIPDEVGGEDNIIEIILRPRFPFAFYTGSDVSSILGNLYLQWMFQKGRQGGMTDFLGDYYMTLSTEKDYNIILGTEIKWNFYNGRMFIHPEPAGLIAAIRFRSAISLEEVNTNELIRMFALARCKQVLGTIRSTFGGTIPGGTENITLRGESLIAEGKEEEQAVIATLRSMEEPLFLTWG